MTQPRHRPCLNPACACCRRISALWNLANLLVDAQRRLDKAHIVNAQLKKLHETTAAGLIDYIEARRCMAEGSWGAAARLLTRAGADTRHANRIGFSPYMLLAECSDHLWNPDQKLEALRRAVSQQPANIPAARKLALTQAATGDFDAARAGLRKLIKKGVPVKADLVARASGSGSAHQRPAAFERSGPASKH